MQSDARKEERHQEFSDAVRQVAHALSGAFGQREAGQERAHDRRDADVDGGERQREQQAHAPARTAPRRPAAF